MPLYPSGQGLSPNDTTGLILQGLEESDNRFPVIAGTYHQFYRHDLCTAAVPIPGHAMQCEAQLITSVAALTNGHCRHKEHIPQASSLILIDLTVIVGILPGYAILPDRAG